MSFMAHEMSFMAHEMSFMAHGMSFMAHGMSFMAHEMSFMAHEGSCQTRGLVCDASVRATAAVCHHDCRDRVQYTIIISKLGVSKL